MLRTQKLNKAAIIWAITKEEPLIQYDGHMATFGFKQLAAANAALIADETGVTVEVKTFRKLRKALLRRIRGGKSMNKHPPSWLVQFLTTEDHALAAYLNYLSFQFEIIYPEIGKRQLFEFFESTDLLAAVELYREGDDDFKSLLGIHSRISAIMLVGRHCEEDKQNPLELSDDNASANDAPDVMQNVSEEVPICVPGGNTKKRSLHKKAE